MREPPPGLYVAIFGFMGNDDDFLEFQSDMARANLPLFSGRFRFAVNQVSCAGRNGLPVWNSALFVLFLP